MTFHETARCGYTRYVQEGSIPHKPGKWLVGREAALQRMMAASINSYLKATTDAVLFEAAEKRSQDRARNADLFVTDGTGRSQPVGGCVAVPGRKDGTSGNPIRLSDLDAQAAEVFGLLKDIRWLISDFDRGTQADRKNIFAMLFDDEQQQFDEMCREVFG